MLMGRIEQLARRLADLEKAESEGTIILSDGSAWKPKLPLLNMLLALLDAETSPTTGTPYEVLAEAQQWAKYHHREGEPALYGFLAIMSRNLSQKKKEN